MAFNRCFPVRGDIALTADGSDLLLVEGAAAVRQRIKLALSTFKGSWRYDLNEGVPYFQEILVFGANVELVRQRYYEELLKVPGVLGVTRLTIQFDSAAQTIYVTFEVQSENGTIADTIDLVAQ
jgi:hypothetical protein